jgi:hypothetical protein
MKKLILYTSLLSVFLTFSQENTETIESQINFIKQNISLNEKEVIRLYSLKAETKVLFDLLKKIELTDENKKFVKNLIASFMSEGFVSASTYTKDDYPGKNDGMPFEWWKDEKYIKEHFKMN